jgi:8-oxo-dGTP pyrophosphatase MutT (NUDIX family)
MGEPAYRRPEKVLVYLYRRATSWGDPPQDRPKRLEYLLLQRQPGTTNAGSIWQTVVGGVWWQEERVEAARREVFEETGLTMVRGIMAIGYAFSFPIRLRKNQESWYAPGVATIVNTVYAGEVVSARPIVLCKEHIDYGWFPYANALRRLHWPEEREALSRLHPMIAAKAQPGIVQPA